MMTSSNIYWSGILSSEHNRWCSYGIRSEPWIFYETPYIFKYYSLWLQMNQTSSRIIKIISHLTGFIFITRKSLFRLVCLTYLFTYFNWCKIVLRTTISTSKSLVLFNTHYDIHAKKVLLTLFWIVQICLALLFHLTFVKYSNVYSSWSSVCVNGKFNTLSLLKKEAI